MFKNIFLAAILAAALKAYSHGENKPGPHGGFIKMPGGFHTELVPGTGSKIKVYLLDIEWKNPTTENSGVTLNSKPCTPEQDVFICELDKKLDLKKKGSLTVEASRQGQKGNPAVYDLPLSLSKKQMDHKHH